jgi:hypothetical protein
MLIWPNAEKPRIPLSVPVSVLPPLGRNRGARGNRVSSFVRLCPFIENALPYGPSAVSRGKVDPCYSVECRCIVVVNGPSRCLETPNAHHPSATAQTAATAIGRVPPNRLVKSAVTILLNRSVVACRAIA